MAGYVLETNVENLTFVEDGRLLRPGQRARQRDRQRHRRRPAARLRRNDTLTGGAGADQLEGGDGDDVFLVAEDDFVFGETYQRRRSAPTSCNYTGTSDIDLSGATLTGVERVVCPRP